MKKLALFSLVAALAGCSSPQQAVTGVFTAEEVICMADGLIAGQLTGTPAVIAADLQAACKIAPALTSDIVAFVQAFQTSAPAVQAQWASYVAAHKGAGK
jgi:hypothetical protein